MDAALEQLLDQARAEGWIDWVRGPADHHAMLNGCYFDVKAADHGRAFFRTFLKHTSDRFVGTRFELLEWQFREVVGRIFGWRRADGLRRFNKAYISTAKKNGKTGLLAGLALYLLLTDGAGTEIYSAAADREQASILFREAAAMVRANPQLARMVRVKESTKTLLFTGSDRPSLFRALSADAKTKEGLNAAVILADELHAWPGRELYDALNYAGSARQNPLFLIITTAGDDLETVCGEEYLRAKRWLTGEYTDDAYFAFVAEADPVEDWESEETWKKANPSLGITVTVDKFRADHVEAKESPAKEAGFRRYRLNQWCRAHDVWLSMDAWNACPKEIDLAAMAGRDCIAGLDLSSVDDLTASLLLFPGEDEHVTVLPRFYLPADNIVRLEKKHRVPYRAWAKAGHITLTPGNVVDYSFVRDDLKALATTYHITHVGMDRAWQGQALESQLIEDGHDVVPVGAGWRSQDMPAKRLEALVKAGKLNHGNHPILRWNAGNAVVEVDKAGNYSLNKKRSRSKIDGIAALLIALYVRLNTTETESGSYYAEGGEPIFL